MFVCTSHRTQIKHLGSLFALYLWGEAWRGYAEYSGVTGLQLLPNELEASLRSVSGLRNDVRESVKDIADLRLVRHSNQSHVRAVEAHRVEVW
jgi:hypothetical protein